MSTTSLSEPDRCPWCESAPDYRRYHDEEWGRPRTKDSELFERLSLEAFQSGLSWLTILRKRENFRAAFAGFDLEAVARFGPTDVERLLGDAGIVRNRAKIEATLQNARAAVRLVAEEGSLARFIWSFAPAPRPAPVTMKDLPGQTPETVALSKALKRRGFCFVGPTTLYALFQAVGVVNDHLASCHVREAVALEQARARAR
ncbi:MAG TPA: DNA-3-methyladenine glycosylase I [Myxococcaceae bacterium]|nr:DNA-3-methyladenine glycosylase I [Myxococcaceae bacterium]